MTIPVLQFWFEFASTYSYVAALRIAQMAGRAGVEVEWNPFLLGPIFRAQGWNDSPFNLYAAKGRYMWRDMERLCQKYRIPFTRPTQFPRNGLLAARVALLGRAEPWCPHFVRAVFRANFGEDKDIASPDTIGAILHRLELQAHEIIRRAESPDHKDRLRRQTEHAAACGIFGAPTFVAGGELF